MQHPLGSTAPLAGTELWDPVLPPRCLFPGLLGFAGLIRREMCCGIQAGLGQALLESSLGLQHALGQRLENRDKTVQLKCTVLPFPWG